MKSILRVSRIRSPRATAFSLTLLLGVLSLFGVWADSLVADRSGAVGLGALAELHQAHCADAGEDPRTGALSGWTGHAGQMSCLIGPAPEHLC